MEAPAKLEAQAAVARLEDAQRRLVELAPGVAEGAKLIRRATEVERDLALAREHDRASAALHWSAAELAAKLGRPLEERAPLAEAVNALAENVADHIARLEASAVTRESARRALAEVVRGEATRQELDTGIAQASASADRIAAAIGELDRRRDVMKKVSTQVETARDAIVRQVHEFAESRLARPVRAARARGAVRAGVPGSRLGARAGGSQA